MEMYIEEMQADKRRKLSMEDQGLTLEADSEHYPFCMRFRLHLFSRISIS